MRTHYVPGSDVIKVVREEVFNTHSIMVYWEKISQDTPKRFEIYSLELLGAIIDLWITIRGYSFSKGWMANFERKHEKGTRKNLDDK